MRKLLIFIIVILVLLGLAYIKVSSKGGREEEIEQIVTVEVAPVAKGSVRKTIEVIGTVLADKTAQVIPETMGRVTGIMVKEGAYVRKGSRIIAIRNETIGFEYEEGYITSPINGNVAKILVDVGSTISPQTPVAMIVDYYRVKISFNVAEVDMGNISRNKKVMVSVDALPNKVFNAKITEITPVVDPMTRTIGVKAVVNNPRKLLKPGMTARVKLILGSKDHVVSIPKYALLNDHLFIVKDSTAHRRSVEIGLVGDKNVEIISGLNVGERVVIVGQKRLAGGEKVKPILKEQ